MILGGWWDGRSEVGDDEFAEGDPAVLVLDRVAAFDLLELKAFVEAPDIGVVVVGEDEAAFDFLHDLCQALRTSSAHPHPADCAREQRSPVRKIRKLQIRGGLTVSRLDPRAGCQIRLGSKRCSSTRTSTIPTTRPFFNNAWTVDGKAPKNASGRMETSPPMSTGIPTTI